MSKWLKILLFHLYQIYIEDPNFVPKYSNNMRICQYVCAFLLYFFFFFESLIINISIFVNNTVLIFCKFFFLLFHLFRIEITLVICFSYLYLRAHLIHCEFIPK